jgi:hypothetical protein
MTDKQTIKQEGQHTTGVWRQCRVKLIIEHSTSHQLLWFIESFVLRNPPLRKDANYNTPPNSDQRGS